MGKHGWPPTRSVPKIYLVFLRAGNVESDSSRRVNQVARTIDLLVLRSWRSARLSSGASNISPMQEFGYGIANSGTNRHRRGWGGAPAGAVTPAAQPSGSVALFVAKLSSDPVNAL